MTSTNDGKDVKSNLTSGPKGKSYYIELYKSLEAALGSTAGLSERCEALCRAWSRVHCLCVHSAPSTHPHLLAWLQRHTARTLLQTEWQSPSNAAERQNLENAIDGFLEETAAATAARSGSQHSWEAMLVLRAEWFKKTLADPWGHPVLRRLLDPSQPQPDQLEILEWLKEERGVMFVTRLRQLAASKCNDLALSLSTAVTDRVRASADEDAGKESTDKPPESGEKLTPFGETLKAEAGFTTDVWELLTDIEFVLLHKLERTDRCIQLAKQTPLRSGYQLVERLRTRLETSPREKKLWKNAKDVATLIAQVIIARCMVNTVCADVTRAALYCCSRSLVRLLPAAQLPAAAAALAAPAATSRHLHTLAAAVEAQCKDEMKAFVCELYVRAITAGMNELERLKLKTEKDTEARSAEQTLSSWFLQIGSLLSASPRVNCECMLTSFSVHPSPAMYERLRNAPPLPMFNLKRETKEEPSSSEFGSWANDSRSHTNFVKTSEHLNLKHDETHQVNVLSTAILTEGETLGLSAELCQDLAVLLSGPRVKTLSWDMDRDQLLENCRVYMERTRGGTRTLTKELKYLNLDLKQFQHLPEEDEGEDDIYYGIEKGYEHLVELPEPVPEEIWADALTDQERTTSACSSSFEDLHADKYERRKKKNSKSYSSDEVDPLSLHAEHKKEKSKGTKERKHKHKSKTHSRESSVSRERRKEGSTGKEKAPKKEKKERKRKQFTEMPLTEGNGSKPSGSLSSLIGIKVCASTNETMPIMPILSELKVQKRKSKEPNNKKLSCTDSDYESQEKSSLASMTSLDTEKETNVVFDGVFSMDDLKMSPPKSYSPPKTYSKVEHPGHLANLARNNELSFSTVAVTSNAHLQNSLVLPNRNPSSTTPTIQRLPLDSARTTTPVPPECLSISYGSPVGDEVRERMTKLLQFRKQKSTPSSPISAAQSPSQSVISPELKTCLPKELQATSCNKPEVDSFSSHKKAQEKGDIMSPIDFIKNNYPNLRLNLVSKNQATKSLEISGGVIKPVNSLTMSKLATNTSPITDSASTQSVIKSTHKRSIKPTPSAVCAAQKEQIPSGLHKILGMKDFLSELQAKTAGTKQELSVRRTSKDGPATSVNMQSSEPHVVIKKSDHVIASPNSILPQSAKPFVQQKKGENAPNTFARLSYMHKNKQVDTKVVQTTETVQRQLTEQEQISNELERHILEYKYKKLQQLKNQGKATVSKIDKDVQNAMAMSKMPNQKTELNIGTPTKTISTNPVISSILTSPDKSNDYKMNASSKDYSEPFRVPTPSTVTSATQLLFTQNELHNLVQQRNKLNAQNLSFQDYYSNNTMNSSKVPISRPNSIITATGSSNTVTNQNQNIQCPSRTSTPIPNEALPVDKINKEPIPLTKSVITAAPSSNLKISKTLQITAKKETPLCKKATKLDKTNKIKKDLESVMNAIIARKTPNRGLNPLDMTLNKNQKESMSYLENQRIAKPSEVQKEPNIELTTSTKAKRGKNQHAARTLPYQYTKHDNNEIHTNFEQIVAENSSSVIIKPSKNVKKQTKSETSKSYENESQKKPNQIPTPKKPTNQLEETNLLNATSIAPNADEYALLDDLMDMDLLREIDELSDEEDPKFSVTTSNTINQLPSTIPNVTDQTIIKPAITPNTQEVIQSKENYVGMRVKYAENAGVFKIEPNTKPNTVIGLAKNIIIQPKRDKTINKEPASTTTIVNSIVPQQQQSTSQYNIVNNNLMINNSVNAEQPRTILITSAPVVRPSVVLVQPTVGSNTIQIQETQIFAPTLSVNQATYLVNRPNIAVFQSTRYSAPAINQCIVGNALTNTNDVSHSRNYKNVSNVQNKPVQSVPNNTIDTHDLTKYTTYMPSDEPEINVQFPKLVPEINKQIPKQANVTIDHNLNKHIDRKVLSEVQDKFTVTLEKPEIKYTEEFKTEPLDINLDHFKEQKTYSQNDLERIAGKRQAILNRPLVKPPEYGPIVLKYTPLRNDKLNTKKSGKSKKKASIKNALTGLSSNDTDTEKQVSKMMNIIKSSYTNELQVKEAEMAPTLEATTESFKENATADKGRRILLRSSNKLKEPTMLTKETKNTSRRKTKVRLKSTSIDVQQTHKITPKIVPDTTNLDKNINKPDKKEGVITTTATRVSKRILNKISSSSDTAEEKDSGKDVELFKKALSSPKHKGNVSDVSIEQFDIEAKLVGSKISKEEPIGPIDIEAELLGSIICSTVTKTIPKMTIKKVQGSKKPKHKIELSPKKEGEAASTKVLQIKVNDASIDMKSNKTTSAETLKVIKTKDKELPTSSKLLLTENNTTLQANSLANEITPSAVKETVTKEILPEKTTDSSTTLLKTKEHCAPLQSKTKNIQNTEIKNDTIEIKPKKCETSLTKETLENFKSDETTTCPKIIPEETKKPQDARIVVDKIPPLEDIPLFDMEVDDDPVVRSKLKISNDVTPPDNSLPPVTITPSKYIAKSEKCISNKVETVHSEATREDLEKAKTRENKKELTESATTDDSAKSHTTIPEPIKTNVTEIIETDKLVNKTTITSEFSNREVSKIVSLSGLTKEKVILEHLRDIPAKNGQPAKKCVRIRLPNEKAFKMTVSGTTDVNFETLMADPQIINIINNCDPTSKRYKLNIMHSVLNNESKVMESQEIKASSEVLDTIDLISDEDNEDAKTARFKTEFGIYKVAAENFKFIENHQDKFNQKCSVQLIKHPDSFFLRQASIESDKQRDVKDYCIEIPESDQEIEKPNVSLSCKDVNSPQSSPIPVNEPCHKDDVAIEKAELAIGSDKQSDVKDDCIEISESDQEIEKLNVFSPCKDVNSPPSSPIIINSQCNKDDVENEKSELALQLSLTEQELFSVIAKEIDKVRGSAPLKEILPEVIDLDDSSDDELKSLVIVPPAIQIEPNSIPSQPERKIDELKNLLLSDLGVVVKEKPLPPKEKLQIIDEKLLKKCQIKLVRCDILLKKYQEELLLPAKINSPAKCDNITIEDSDDIIVVSDTEISVDITSPTTTPKREINRTGSPSILFDYLHSETPANDCDLCDFDLLPSEDSSIIYDGKTSPVIEVFEVIASFCSKDLAKREASEQKKNIHIKCEADWFNTKQPLRLLEKVDQLDNKLSNLAKSETSEQKKNIIHIKCEADWFNTKQPLRLLEKVDQLDNILETTFIVSSLLSTVLKYFENNDVLELLIPVKITTEKSSLPSSKKKSISPSRRNLKRKSILTEETSVVKKLLKSNTETTNENNIILSSLDYSTTAIEIFQNIDEANRHPAATTNMKTKELIIEEQNPIQTDNTNGQNLIINKSSISCVTDDTEDENIAENILGDEESALDVLDANDQKLLIFANSVVENKQTIINQQINQKTELLVVKAKCFESEIKINDKVTKGCDNKDIQPLQNFTITEDKELLTDGDALSYSGSDQSATMPIKEETNVFNESLNLNSVMDRNIIKIIPEMDSTPKCTENDILNEADDLDDNQQHREKIFPVNLKSDSKSNKVAEDVFAEQRQPIPENIEESKHIKQSSLSEACSTIAENAENYVIKDDKIDTENPVSIKLKLESNSVIKTLKLKSQREDTKEFIEESPHIVNAGGNVGFIVTESFTANLSTDKDKASECHVDDVPLVSCDNDIKETLKSNTCFDRDVEIFCSEPESSDCHGETHHETIRVTKITLDVNSNDNIVKCTAEERMTQGPGSNVIKLKTTKSENVIMESSKESGCATIIDSLEIKKILRHLNTDSQDNHEGSSNKRNTQSFAKEAYTNLEENKNREVLEVKSDSQTIHKLTVSEDMVLDDNDCFPVTDVVSDLKLEISKESRNSCSLTFIENKIGSESDDLKTETNQSTLIHEGDLQTRRQEDTNIQKTLPMEQNPSRIVGDDNFALSFSIPVSVDRIEGDSNCSFPKGSDVNINSRNVMEKAENITEDTTNVESRFENIIGNKTQYANDVVSQVAVGRQNNVFEEKSLEVNKHTKKEMKFRHKEAESVDTRSPVNKKMSKESEAAGNISVDYTMMTRDNEAKTSISNGAEVNNELHENTGVTESCKKSKLNDILVENKYIDFDRNKDPLMQEVNEDVSKDFLLKNPNNIDTSESVVRRTPEIDRPGIILKGIEIHDPFVGTCYVFQPIDDSASETASVKTNDSEALNESNDDMFEIVKKFDEDECSEGNSNASEAISEVNPMVVPFGTSTPDTSISLETEEEQLDSIEHAEFNIFKIIPPKKTYEIMKNRKRKIGMKDVKFQDKKLRKAKNIDHPKQSTFSINELSCSKEFDQTLKYLKSLNLSFSRSYHYLSLDLNEAFQNWPLNGPIIVNDEPTDINENQIFSDVDHYKLEEHLKSLNKSLMEEIKTNLEDIDSSVENKVTNFKMGFGEGSGRVIQNLKEGGYISKFSAATLSDVKQSQPFLLSEDYEDCEDDEPQFSCNQEQIELLRRYISYIQLKNKVRSFFEKIKLELLSNSNEQVKLTKDQSAESDVCRVLQNVPGLYGTDFIKPPPLVPFVQVVQVGQLPVSAAAQNPVTCDPRVTQVSDASPSQCSVESSPRSDNQPNIKAEYTELTNADLSVPIVQGMTNQNQSMTPKSQDKNLTEQHVIPKEFEIRGEIKEQSLKNQSKDSSMSDNQESMDYQYEATSNNDTISQLTADQLMFSSQSNTSSQSNETERYLNKQENGVMEKTDQIAHAMNAAGITTTPETTVTTTSTHPLVNILTQKMQMRSVSTGQTSTINSYPKTSINAMALQQALASILPPPLNQTSTGNNNQTSNATVAPQVLHIVQGKNATGNQITLVDNSQQSVISTPNATQVLHIVQNKSAAAATSNGTPSGQTNSFSGLSLVDTGLQKGGHQLLHILNTGNQNNTNAGQLLKKVNLLTNLTNVQGGNEQKMVQFVCKSADGKAIHLNAPHQRSMVLRLQPIETPPPPTPKATETQGLSSPSQTANNTLAGKEAAAQQEIKSRSVYEENYAKFIQNTSAKTSVMTEKSTSLPKFNQAFGKPVFQDGTQKQNEMNTNLTPVHTTEGGECPQAENTINLDHIGQISSPPLLLRKTTAPTSQAQQNLVQQIKQTIAPMNIQTMHGGVIYTRQIPVNIGGGQTINLITVPSTELVDDSGQKQSTDVKFISQNDMEPSIIKIVPQNQPSTEGNTEENSHLGVSNDNPPTQQPQQVLTQMRIKLPMLSKQPQVMPGARVVRPSFFQIQRNIVSGANQPVYQQLVLTAAPPLGQQTIRLPQAQARTVKVETPSPATSESQLSSSTLEQLREFDMVLEQVKERSTVTNSSPSASSTNTFTNKIPTPSTDTTDSPMPVSTATNATTTTTRSDFSTHQNVFSIGNSSTMSVSYVNRKSTVTTPTTSTYVRSPDSSGIADSPSSSSSHLPSVVSETQTSSESSVPKPAAKIGSKSVKSRPTKPSTTHPPSIPKVNHIPPKTTTQKPLEDEQTTQRILYILAEYKEQVENSPDKDKPAPRRRSNPPSNPGGSSKRKKSSNGSRRPGCTRDHSPIDGADGCRTMGSEDSSCGTSQGDCTESCSIDAHSPQDSPRKVVRKLTFEHETVSPIVTQPRVQPARNVIVADGQTITVARSTTGKPTTAVLMPANYILPVSMVKGGQQIAIVTNRGPKLLTVGGTNAESGAANALLLQRLIGPAGLKPVLARPGVRHVRLPTAALHNLQAFNLAAAATPIQPPDSTASPAPAPTPPELVETRATSSPWDNRDPAPEIKPEPSPEASSPWHLQSSDPPDYTYEEPVTSRSDAVDRTVLDPIQDRYSPDMEAQRIFDKMFDVDTKKSYGHEDSPRVSHGYDIDPSHSDCDEKSYHQVVQKKDGSSHALHRVGHISSAALRHKYAILEHELRLQKSLSEECEDLGVDSPSASELFPEAELLFAASPAPHDHAHDHHHPHPHTPQPSVLSQTSIPHPDMDDQIATDHLLPVPRPIHEEGLKQELNDVNLSGLEDVGIVTVSEDGMQATIQLDQEEFARSHPNTTFHSEPTDGEVQPFTLHPSSGLKTRHITQTIFHSNSAPTTVLMTAPAQTVISQTTPETSGVHNNNVKYIDNMIHNLPSSHGNSDINLSSVLTKDEGLTRFDSILTDSRELHLSNTASAIVHSGNATQVIRRVCYDDVKRDDRFLMDDQDALIAGDDAKMIAEDSSRDATLESIGGDADDDGSSPERHAELFWESNSASERSESRRPLDFSSDSDKCCKSPSLDETNSTDSSGVGTHLRLDSVIKEARGRERSGSADGSSADDTLHPPIRTYPPKRPFHPEGDIERSLSGKTRAGERSPDSPEVRRRASNRGVVKRGCHCCNGSPTPSRPKKPRQRKPALDFNHSN